MTKQKIKELEERDAAGYSRIPVEASEIEEWQDEQVWIEDGGFAQDDNASQDRMTTSGETKIREEDLKRAAAIRHELEGRDHSNSTELVAEDRNGTTDDSMAERELLLEDLLAGVTKKNLHSEINPGPAIGKEEC